MTTTPLPRSPRGGTPTGYIASYATTVVGTADQLANLLTNHRTAGTLIAVGRPLALPYRPGHYQVRIRLRTTTTTIADRRADVRRPAITAPAAHSRRTPGRRTRHVAIGTVLATATAGVLATIAYLLGVLAELIATHLRDLLIVGVFAGLLTAALSVRRRKHCPGC
jgi:hypothetical protein